MLAALPMFLAIGFMCYSILVDRFQWSALVVMLICITASFMFMENYYDNHETKPAEPTRINCVQKTDTILICRR